MSWARYVPGLGNVTLGIKIPVRVGLSMRTSTRLPLSHVALKVRLPVVTACPSAMTVAWTNGSMASPATGYGRSKKMSSLSAQMVVLTLGASPPCAWAPPA